MAMELAVAIKAAENGAEKPPCSIMAGIRTAPSAATVAGTGDRAKEAGYDYTHDGDAASSVSDTGINKPDQALGDACLCHDVAGQYKKRNGKQQKLADAGIHVGCHDR